MSTAASLRRLIIRSMSASRYASLMAADGKDENRPIAWDDKAKKVGLVSCKLSSQQRRQIQAIHDLYQRTNQRYE